MRAATGSKNMIGSVVIACAPVSAFAPAVNIELMRVLGPLRRGQFRPPCLAAQSFFSLPAEPIPLSLNPTGAPSLTADKMGRGETTMTARRLPPPWSVEDIGGYFFVKVSNGRPLVFISYKEGGARRSLARLLTRNAARRIAVGIAKLPELLRNA
jgi:hypothetical protein